MDHPQMGRIGIIAIYAPKFYHERASLWHELADTLDKSRSWILAGDFNMVESCTDHKGGSSAILNGIELRVWHRLHKMLNLEDLYQHRPGQLWFRWDSKNIHRHGPLVQSRLVIGDRVLKRPDWVYSSVPSQRRKFNITSTILPGFALPDHAPGIATISFAGFKDRPSLYCLNVIHLANESLIEKLSTLWQENLSSVQSKVEEMFFKGLYESKRLTRSHGKNKTVVRKKRRKAYRLL